MRIIEINIRYIIVRGNKNEFIDQNKELCPDCYDSHVYRNFHMTVFVCLYRPLPFIVNVFVLNKSFVIVIIICHLFDSCCVSLSRENEQTQTSDTNWACKYKQPTFSLGATVQIDFL